MQVYLGNKLVGRWNRSVNTQATFCEVVIRDEPDMPYDPSKPWEETILATRRVAMKIGERGTHIDAFELKLNPSALHETLKAYDVPADYHQYDDFQRDRKLIRWKVLEVTPEIFEEIFDLDDFEPDDKFDKPDIERRQRELLDLADYGRAI